MIRRCRLPTHTLDRTLTREPRDSGIRHNTLQTHTHTVEFSDRWPATMRRVDEEPIVRPALERVAHLGAHEPARHQQSAHRRQPAYSARPDFFLLAHTFEQASLKERFRSLSDSKTLDGRGLERHGHTPRESLFTQTLEGLEKNWASTLKKIKDFGTASCPAASAPTPNDSSDLRFVISSSQRSFPARFGRSTVQTKIPKVRGSPQHSPSSKARKPSHPISNTNGILNQRPVVGRWSAPGTRPGS